ncbi:MAG: CoA ester lyase [Rhodospirillales bacterium]
MPTLNLRPRRSFLYVPASRPDRFPKAMSSGADMVCVDLEDAVASDAKDQARLDAIALFAGPERGPERLLRINSLATDHGRADLAAVAAADQPPDGILLPKVRGVEEILSAIDAVGHHADLKLHIQMETNEALEHAMDMARAHGLVASLVFGGFDMAAALRVEPGWDALLYARGRLVHAAAGAGIDLLDMPYFGLDDEAGLRAEAAKAKAIGFTGKTAIHPKQIDAINETYSPTPEEAARARELIAKFEAQDQAFVVIDGEILEAPVIERLYRTIAAADSIGI